MMKPAGYAACKRIVRAAVHRAVSQRRIRVTAEDIARATAQEGRK